MDNPVPRLPAPQPRHLRRRAVASTGPVAVALLLAACGGSSSQPHVASLSTHGNAASHRSAAAPQSVNAGVPDPGGRPREPLNATAAQEAALWGPYTACLRAHNYIDQFSLTSKLAVVARCKRLEPLPPWPLDPTNPQARAFIGRTVTCLRAKGYQASANLVSDIPFQAPDWEISYSPHSVQFEHRTGLAQDACQERALG